MVNMTHELHQSQRNNLAIMLLCTGLFMFSISLVFLLNSNDTLAALKRQKEQHLISSKATAAKPRLNDQQTAELSAVNAAIQDIVRPWPTLFKALESGHLEAVNVLSVEPNVKSKTFYITAVALSIDSMQAYIVGLNQQDISKFVSLISTQSVEVDGQDATQFELLLKW